MGVCIDYSFHAESPEEELLARLRRLRQRVSRLPLRRVGRIVRLDPAYESMPLEHLRAYDNRCAITDVNAGEALEAAHIIPHSESGPAEVTNGILLRADIHNLFDLHLIRITPHRRIEVDEMLKPTCYWQYDGRELRCPENTEDWPSQESLTLRWRIVMEYELIW